jgi:hypothetical protein
MTLSGGARLLHAPKFNSSINFLSSMETGAAGIL